QLEAGIPGLTEVEDNRLRDTWVEPEPELQGPLLTGERLQELLRSDGWAVQTDGLAVMAPHMLQGDGPLKTGERHGRFRAGRHAQRPTELARHQPAATHQAQVV